MKTPVSSLVVATFFWSSVASAQPIDRHALVTRHNPVLREFDIESPLSVGNGQFAFTADATGLQSFPAKFARTIPLGTLSHWGWHTAPNPNGWSIDKFKYTEFESAGRKVGYADFRNDRRLETEWLRSNPHRLHLGQIGFRFTKKDGTRATASDLADIEQSLDLWNGILKSNFKVDGQPVEVETVCHPTLDLLAVRVTSLLVSHQQLAIEMRFPMEPAKPSRPIGIDRKPTKRLCKALHSPLAVCASLGRRYVSCHSALGAWWLAWQRTKHHYELATPGDSQSLEFVCLFTPHRPEIRLPDFADTRAAAVAHWNEFWKSGGVIDLSGSRDQGWRELERRIVLSQYLTAIQCSGPYPPAETGLTYNSWYGKFHLEMHWWHAVHFALWNRIELLERSLGYYQAILPRAKQTAARQGYEGARWPKMTDPSGAESPSGVGPFLIWQQPHPIYYAELCYRARPDRETLERFRDIVFETSNFLASYPNWDEANQRYYLGPILQGAQEEFPNDRTVNLTFELTYRRWGLGAAQKWRERLGLPRDDKWDRVLTQLSPAPVSDGKYLFAESAPDSYSNRRWRNDHPAVLGAFGMLPGPGIDRLTMRRTADWVWDNWNWPDTWGWDYPLVAMNAARLGQPVRAVDALLMDTPKNQHRNNGHNHQRPGLTIYLPGNGGLLTAVAMMAAGWDGAPDQHAPGFPDDGSWQLRWANLRRMP